jgi:Domain of unknown function (DUF3427)
MACVTFNQITVGDTYSRIELARIWGYRTFHAIAKGVVTPAGDDKIVLFVTENKKSDREPYEDRLVGSTLHWEGPTDHLAEERMRPGRGGSDEIHVFYRRDADADFKYLGEVDVTGYTGYVSQPSRFTFRLRQLS